MHGKASYKLHSIQGNRFFNGPITVVFCNEGYFAFSNVQNSLVCNSYAVGVLPQIFYHMISACQRRFTIYHPFGSVRLLYPVIEQKQLILLSQGTFEAVQEPALEGLTELLYRIELFPCMPDVFPLS